MRALAWNCRGANSEDSTTMPYIRWLVRKANPDFVFLSETKCLASVLSAKFIRIGCKGFTGVDALNLSGGLFVTWFSSNMVVKTEECTKNFVLCNIIDGPYFYYLCFLYGAPKLENRHELSLRTKKVEAQIIYQEPQKLLSHGPAFTRCNNREGKDVIYEQLDRAYCNEQWRSMFPEALVVNYEILASDHGAILLETSPRRIKRKRPYKIEAWCLDDPQVKEIISQL
ncbi:putative RNA-directed DNA polymerase from transposon X-element [Bienertia sinuspersici]